MKRQPVRLALFLAAAILASPPALAQTPAGPPSPPSAADAAFAAQKAAFLALPPATRKAAQDSLVWLGLYNGANDGEFGRRTRDFDRRLPAEPKGNRRRRPLARPASGAARARLRRCASQPASGPSTTPGPARGSARRRT